MFEDPKLGDTVWISKLQQNGKIVAKQGLDRYTVQVGSNKFQLRRSDLEEQQPGKAQRSQPSRPADPLSEVRLHRAPSKIDLHGLNAEDARERVETAIDQAIRASLDRLEIVHGKGSGVLREVTHSVIKDIPTITRFVCDPLNPGVTIAYFRR